MCRINWLVAFLTLLLGTVCAYSQNQEPFWLGADISGTLQMERHGVKLYNQGGAERENTALMKELGLNAVRLRVWVDPKEGECNPEYVLNMALRAKRLDMAIMIDFHYSDWWADPAKQNIPHDWKSFSYGKMKKALARHTYETLKLLRDNGVDVKWVQVGNETTDGFLWDVGRASTNMRQYAGLTDAGYKAVKKVYPQATVIVHLDGGSDIERYHRIFDGLRRYHARWDMIGMSLYPYWDKEAHITQSAQETVERFTANIRQLADEYQCDFMVVETGTEVSKPDEGKKIMQSIIEGAAFNTGGHCKGVFYWAPELEGPYPLGAFRNHRPTVIMEAFTEASAKLNHH